MPPAPLTDPPSAWPRQTWSPHLNLHVWTAAPGNLSSNKGRRNHMGRSLQQRPITPPHPPAPLCLATHALNCSHTLRTQCYASVWAQAITPGCALASFDCSNMGRDLQQHPITPTHPPAPLCFATHALNCSHTLRTQCYASVWAQAITPGSALASSTDPGGKTGQDKTHHQAASPPFPHTHRQPLNHYSPVSKRPWPGGETNIFCRQQDLTRPHHPPPQILRKRFPALICCQVPDCVSR
jgi:hypothetical protein